MSESIFNKPRAVIASPDIYDEAICNLKNMGIEVLLSCKNQGVMPALAHHTDMQITMLTPDIYVSSPECYEYYTELLKEYKIKIRRGNTYLSCNYPGDIAYNITVTEKIAVHNFKHTDSLVKSMLSGKKCVNVSQGYTACTLCAISDTAFITSDAGIYKSLSVEGVDVLLTDDSDILLPGFDHGFIGGSCFMADAKTLAVNGNIELHSSCKKIKEFCNLHSVSLLSLSRNPVMDIGSFIPVF